MPLGIQIENPHRGGDAMDRFGDLLRMRATRSIGIGQDHDVPILEDTASVRNPIWPRRPRKPSWPRSRSWRGYRRPSRPRRSRPAPSLELRSVPAVDTESSGHQACPWPSRCRPSDTAGIAFCRSHPGTFGPSENVRRFGRNRCTRRARSTLPAAGLLLRLRLGSGRPSFLRT